MSIIECLFLPGLSVFERIYIKRLAMLSTAALLEAHSNIFILLGTKPPKTNCKINETINLDFPVPGGPSIRDKCCFCGLMQWKNTFFNISFCPSSNLSYTINKQEKRIRKRKTI